MLTKERKAKHRWLTVPVVAVGHIPRIQNPRIERLYTGVRIPSFERQRSFYLVDKANKVERHETLYCVLFTHSVN
jgi:hypothetical protein